MRKPPGRALLAVVAVGSVLAAGLATGGLAVRAADDRQESGGQDDVPQRHVDHRDSGKRHGGAAASRPAAAVDVLHDWDLRRAAAYAHGDVAALRRLYLPGSPAGARDGHLLRSYLRRGYLVRGMRMQVLAVSVLSRSRGRWRLRVTDRLAHAVAVGQGRKLPLPRDRADTEVLTLRRGDDGAWRMAGVVPAARAGR